MAKPSHIITVTLADDKGGKATAQLKYTGTDANARALAGQLQSRIDDLSVGAIQSVTMTAYVYTSGTLPLSHVDLEEKGQFSFLDADGRTMIISIPGLDESFILPNSNNLSLSATEVANFVSLVTDTVGVVSEANVDIVQLKAAQRKVG